MSEELEATRILPAVDAYYYRHDVGPFWKGGGEYGAYSIVSISMFERPAKTTGATTEEGR